MRDTKLQLILFPVWWYTTGTTIAWQWVKRRFSYKIRSMGLVLFARHLGQPLYGDYTRSGIAISFFLRIFLLLFKIFYLGVYIAGLGFLFLLYLAILPLSIVMILYQIIPF